MRPEVSVLIRFGPDGEICCFPIVQSDGELKELERRLAELPQRLIEDPSLLRRALGLEPKVCATVSAAPAEVDTR